MKRRSHFHEEKNEEMEDGMTTLHDTGIVEGSSVFLLRWCFLCRCSMLLKRRCVYLQGGERVICMVDCTEKLQLGLMGRCGCRD